MKGTQSVAEKRIDALTKATATVAKAHPGLYIGEAGSISSNKALNAEFGKQLAQAGERSIPLTLIVLLLVFGTLVAAWIPLLLALSAVIATTGLVAVASHAIPMDSNVSAVVLLIGLAVGVDYTLFYVQREREERAAGRGHRAALEAAAATSGRSVLISGLTVMVAMAGMFLTRDKTFMSFSIATMMVVGVAMIGSLTVLPAILSKLGDRVEKGRIPFLGRLRRQGGENRVWAKVLTPALRHPVDRGRRVDRRARSRSPCRCSTCTPPSRVSTRCRGTCRRSRRSTACRRPSSARPTRHSSPCRPTTGTPAFAAAVRKLKAKVATTAGLHGPVNVDVNSSQTAARIEIPVDGNGVDAVSTHALLRLRNDVLPSTIGQLPDATWAVTGGTAASYDANQAMKQSAPLVFGFVLFFAFALLLVAFRSVVIAAKAVVLNLLSVGAAYGVVVAVFQYGWGEHLLNFQSNGGIAQWLPIFMFVILFGLSMDYHVFILSRVREAFDRGMSTEDAVAHGIKTTAGTVSSAALVMVGVFSIFATLPIIDMKEMGIGLAAAVLIDATLVRAVLLPATMQLLGDRNWYLPSWLGWLPRLEHEPSPATA